jgi:hypothetical protein
VSTKPARKTHPELFKSLSRVLGARQAVRALTTLKYANEGTGWLYLCFVWHNTPQGHDYWSKLHYRLVTTDPAYRKRCFN